MNTRSFFGSRAIAATVISLVVLGGVGYYFSIAEATQLWSPLKTYITGRVSYVADIDSEITALEHELAEIDVKLAAGTLTEKEAVAAQTKIAERLADITAHVDAAQAAEFTPEMKRTINDALGRLNIVLVTYRDSLMQIDDIVVGPFVAASVTDAPKLNPLHGARNSNKKNAARLASLFEQTVESIENLVEAVNEETDIGIAQNEISEIEIETDIENELSDTIDLILAEADDETQSVEKQADDSNETGVVSVEADTVVDDPAQLEEKEL